MKLAAYELFKLSRKKVLVILIPLMLLSNLFLYHREQIREHQQLLAHLDEYYAFEAPYVELPEAAALARITQARDNLLAYTIIWDSTLNPDNDALKQLKQELMHGNPALAAQFEASPYARNSELLRLHLLFAEELYSEIEARNSNRAFVSELRKRADDMLSVSIFQQENSFSYRNIQRTPNDFESIRTIPLQIGLDLGLVTSTRFIMTDIMIGAAILLLCIFLFHHEQEEGLTTLLRSTRKGRVPFIASKLVILAGTAALLALLMYGSILLEAARLYGFGDLSRYIQSSAAFKHANLPLTVLQYLVLFIMGKMAAAMLISLVFACTFILLRSVGRIFLFLIALLTYSYLAYRYIHPLSPFNLFKYINLLAFCDTFRLLSQYNNLNLLGYPVQQLYTSAVVVILLLLALPVVAIAIYIRPISPFSTTLWSRIAVGLRMRWYRPRRTVSLIEHELFKTFVVTRIWVIFLVALLIGYNDLHFDKPRFNQDENFYNLYMNKLAGELTADKLRYIADEQSRFDRLSASYASLLNDYQAGKLSETDYITGKSNLDLFALRDEAFTRIKKQRDSLVELQQTRGITGSFISERSSNYLFKNEYRDMINGLTYSMLLILALSSLFPVDYRNGSIYLLRCTTKGRLPMFTIKYIVGAILALLLFAILYAPQYWNMSRGFAIDDWDAPIQSIELFHNIEPHLTIAQFVGFAHLFQLFGSLVITCMILYFSVLTKKQPQTVLIASVVLMLPLLAQLAGIEAIRTYTLNNVFLPFSAFTESGMLPYFLAYGGMLFALGTGVCLHGWLVFMNQYMITNRNAAASIPTTEVKPQ